MSSNIFKWAIKRLSFYFLLHSADIAFMSLLICAIDWGKESNLAEIIKNSIHLPISWKALWILEIVNKTMLSSKGEYADG